MKQINSRKRILLVDDETHIVELAVARLESWGYEVFTADNGEQGLELAYKQLPDLILLDIMMPKMKGREVCAKLKADAKTRHIPVIFLTALGLGDHVKAGMELGAEGYITKPFEAEDLKERIEVCLARQSKLRERSS